MCMFHQRPKGVYYLDRSRGKKEERTGALERCDLRLKKGATYKAWGDAIVKTDTILDHAREQQTRDRERSSLVRRRSSRGIRAVILSVQRVR